MKAGSLSGSLRCCCAPARPRRHHRPRRHRRRPHHRLPTSSSNRWRSVTCANSQEQSPVDATGLGDHRFDDRLDDVSAAGWKARWISASLPRRARAPSIAAALTRANQVDVLLLRHELEYERWRIADARGLALESTHLYTARRRRGVQPARARIRAGARAPAEPRQATRRVAALPRRRCAKCWYPARVPKVHAETAVKQNAGLIVAARRRDRAADRGAARRGPGKPARQHDARAQRAVATPDLARETPHCPRPRGDFRLGQQLYDQKLALRACSRRCRARKSARGPKPSSPPRAARCTPSRAQVLKGRRGAPPLPEKPSDAQQQRAIRAALDARQCRAAGARCACSDAARAALVDTTEFRARKEPGVVAATSRVEIIEMPAFKQGVALAYCDSPGPLEAGQKTFYAVSPIPASMDARADRFLPARIQLALDPQSDHARGHARPLPATRACQQVPVDAARGAGLRALRRRLGGVRREADGRPGLRRRRSAHEAGAAQVVPAHHRQRAARPGGARRRHEPRAPP